MDMERRTKVIANSARLIRDAKFLSDNDRCASAFALAVLGLEEIGKVILNIWIEQGMRADDKRLSAHLRKQNAVAALLLAVHAVGEIKKSPAGRPVSDEFTEEVAKALFESAEGRFSEVVTLGALDKTKQLALYFDDWSEELGMQHEKFQNGDVEKIFEQAKGAVAAVADQHYVRVGMAIYCAKIPFLVGKRNKS